MAYAGIDIGGTQLRIGIFDDEGNLTDVYRTDNDRSLGGEKNISRLLDYVKEKGYDVRSYGIASPGPLDLKKGKILNPPNLYGWDNFEIVRYITEQTGKPGRRLLLDKNFLRIACFSSCFFQRARV